MTTISQLCINVYVCTRSEYLKTIKSLSQARAKSNVVTKNSVKRFASGFCYNCFQLYVDRNGKHAHLAETISTIVK